MDGAGMRPRKISAALVLAMAAVVLTTPLAGCATVMEPRREFVLVHNDSDTTLAVGFGDEPRGAQIRPGDISERSIDPDDTGCDGDARVSVWTTDGTVVATFGPPLCDQDEWTVTQAEVDAALAQATTAAPPS
jgi:hypothetical protein